MYFPLHYIYKNAAGISEKMACDTRSTYIRKFELPSKDPIFDFHEISYPTGSEILRELNVMPLPKPKLRVDLYDPAYSPWTNGLTHKKVAGTEAQVT